MIVSVVGPLEVGVELGPKRAFAWAWEWPGWCRSGPGESAALAALASYRPRFQLVAARAGEPFPGEAAPAVDVVERLVGSVTTDFGAPGSIGESDRSQLTDESARRGAALLAAAWELLDEEAGRAPPQLRPGPRGGGPERDAQIEHVLAADAVYARRLGLRAPQALISDPAAVAELRRAILELFRNPGELSGGIRRWPPRYYLRRTAWHVLDHLWELQDRRQ
ncbi:MAG: hypothetical protein ABSF27_08355 [Candidatus Dormibacteria bacterium]